MIPDYNKIRPDTIDSIKRYIELGIPPGDFLWAVLTNDLREAFGRADEGNIRAMFEIVCWLWNYAPAMCWGDEERVKNWLDVKAKARMETKAKAQQNGGPSPL